MISFKNLEDILNITIKWEIKLKDFYDVAEFALQNKESKKVVAVLRENLLKNLEVLKNINISSFGKMGWIRYAPDYKDEDLIPIQKISRESTPDEIFTQILEFEIKLKNFYSTILNKLVTIKQKELFESLAAFKDEQIFEINKFMDRFNQEK